MKTPFLIPIIVAAAVATLTACANPSQRAKPAPNDDRPFSAQTGNFEEHRPGIAQGAHADAHR